MQNKTAGKTVKKSSDKQDNQTAVKYNYKVVGNVDAEHDFQFTVSGRPIWFSNIKDFTSSFTFEKQEGYFSFSVTKRMDKILQDLFIGEVIVPELDLSQFCYFVLEVSNDDASSTIRIPFRYSISITDIKFINGEVVL